MRWILASGSPRRRELLDQIGMAYEVIVSEASEETELTDPAALVQELSHRKAMAVYRELKAGGSRAGKTSSRAAEPGVASSGGGLDAGGDLLGIIGADTVVAIDGRILGKPANEEDALSMLKELEGRHHHVYTGVTLLLEKAGEEEPVSQVFFEETEVEFTPMSDQEIRDYVATGEPMDKAGAYGIQGIGARYIKGIRGDYNNVVGLPVGRLYREIRKELGNGI